MQMMPVTGCAAGGIVALLIICVIGPPLQYLSVDRYNASPQAIIVFVTAAGSLGCLATCLAVPHLTRRMSSRGPAAKVLKRMNLLGLVRAKTHQHGLSSNVIYTGCLHCIFARDALSQYTPKSGAWYHPSPCTAPDVRSCLHARCYGTWNILHNVYISQVTLLCFIVVASCTMETP